MDEPAFKLETVNKLMQQFFHDKQKTKLNGDALKLMAELLKIFVAEGAARAALQAQANNTTPCYLFNQKLNDLMQRVESSPTVETDHLEKILPQLLLDF